VGDQKQLPPTAFFDREVDAGADGEEDEDDGAVAQAGHMESILSLCEARAMSSAMLRWHYRSRHPSLITVSDHEFYDSRLIYPPSPDAGGHFSGLTFTFVDGVYDRGRKRNNPIEAEAIVQAVLRRARERPHETLGVVAMSAAQRDAIRDRLETMRVEHPELEAFCQEGKTEEVFVKNLEAVQGDERAVIFVSIAYGKDANGYRAQAFGPVSGKGGERPLTVLFTRARTKCQVFSSIRYGDIRLDATKRRGPRVLRRFLKYAETGQDDVPVFSGDEKMDSPFEEAVAAALRAYGYEVAPQVGTAGFRIDLAVHNPDDPGRFLLAVECDGARYHSSAWARERDRLRQHVLETKGWTFHRIWSTDWFYNRDVELDRLLRALDRASERARVDARDALPPALSPPAADRPAVPRGAPKSLDPQPVCAKPYREASFQILEKDQQSLHEVAPGVLAEYVAKVVKCEGPVYEGAVIRRLARLWGYKQAGARIRRAVRDGVRHAVGRGTVTQSVENGDRTVLDDPLRKGAPNPRTRSDLDGSWLKQVDMIPPREIRAALRQVVEDSIGIGADECVAEAARRFGFKRSGHKVKTRFGQQIEKMVQRGDLVREGRSGELRL